MIKVAAGHSHDDFTLEENCLVQNYEEVLTVVENSAVVNELSGLFIFL